MRKLRPCSLVRVRVKLRWVTNRPWKAQVRREGGSEQETNLVRTKPPPLPSASNCFALERDAIAPARGTAYVTSFVCSRRGWSQMEKFAHSMGPDKVDWQPLRDHLYAVARLSGQFASRFGSDAWGQAAGLLHDLGKYSAAFQERLDGAATPVDHSTAGAREALRLFGKARGLLLAYLVSGHHAGLPDYGSLGDESALAYRLGRKEIPPYDNFRRDDLTFPSEAELSLGLTPSDAHPHFSVQLFIRMLYSCLVDADFLDTEHFMDPRRSALRTGYPDMPMLRDRLDQYIATKFDGAPDTPVNRRRAAILQACQTRADAPPGLFTLTVPTGGGKTLSSLSFALRHAARHGLDRVVYAIPFTSIIEQNAGVFREALGDEAVIEHHSNVQRPREGRNEHGDEIARLDLATENWDAPLVVTTNVQFFESLFANRSSRCRKLHNLARSVIVLDEAQMVPTDVLEPALSALWELIANYGSTVVLCTATQPALQRFLPPQLQPLEIAPDPSELFTVLRRVEVTRLGEVGDEDLAQRLLLHRQALCIVNTRSHARELFELVRAGGAEGAFHLSARMCPRHRAQVLSRVREALQAGAPCRLVSTQLIEAGVDIDFPVVYRAETGLDQLAQAAGRCNREGRLDRGEVFAFRPTGRPLRGWFQRTAAVAAMVLRDGSDPLAPETIDRYFTTLFDIEGAGLDARHIMQIIAEGGKSLQFQFAEMARLFRLIDEDMVPIVVPWGDDGERLCDRLRSAPSYEVLRRLQSYVVQVYPNELDALQEGGRIELVAVGGDTIALLADHLCYSKELGLQPTGRLDAALIF